MLGVFAKILTDPAVAQVAGKGIKYAVVGTGVAGFGLYHAITGKGLVDVAGNVALGETFEQQGLAGVLKKGTTGAEGADKGLAEGVVDTAMGQGTYQKMGDTAGAVVDTAGNAVRGLRDAAGNLISGGVGMMKGAVQQGGQQQVPQQYVGADGYYPQQTMANGGAGQFTGMFNTIPQMVSNMTGSNVTLTNLAGLIASAYMMMGPFGWMGKIASLLTGNMALKSMRQQPVYVPQQQQQNQIKSVYAPLQQEQVQNDNAVYRTRRM